MEGIHIDIELPTSGLYTLDSLKAELTKYALKLVGVKKDSAAQNAFAEDIKLIQNIAKKTNIPQSVIDEDDRLNYLLNH